MWFNPNCAGLCFNIVSGDDFEPPFNCEVKIENTPNEILKECFDKILDVAKNGNDLSIYEESFFKKCLNFLNGDFLDCISFEEFNEIDDYDEDNEDEDELNFQEDCSCDSFLLKLYVVKINW
jgi:hypothetical protein